MIGSFGHGLTSCRQKGNGLVGYYVADAGRGKRAQVPSGLSVEPETAHFFLLLWLVKQKLMSEIQ